MKTFPMFLTMTGRRVIIAGGGEQAAQKARLMLKTEARLVLIADTLDPELAQLVATGRADQHSGPLCPDTFRGAAIVFIATGCPGADHALHALAQAAGAVVNVVDCPDLCDAITPSVVDRDPVVVAIGTEGTAPVLARQIRARVETMLEPDLGAFAALAGRLRDEVARRIPHARRRAFWDWAFAHSPRQLHATGHEAEAARALKAAIAAGAAPEGATGAISLVGAGPGARDLLTLRAVQRLQEADVIFYDRLVDPEVLELARRDAQRVFVGKSVGANAWPQDRINGVILAAARRGQRVVRLKSGDPGIFGRATEELDAARAAGIPIEIVPGITAAVAAAASLGRPLTERGQTDHVVFATGTCRDGADAPDWGAMLTPGTTLALYMAMHRLADLRDSLIASGLPAQTEIEVVAGASQRGERILRTTIAHLPADAEDAGLSNPAIIFLRRAKTAERACTQRAEITRRVSAR
ncbi:MAG: uroporphyrinogen-III C-methyltransferase [Rhodobacteraceae bacterium]|nr:uroporphyrinogen-III C-methyltransferase [Paracoccaceae bacterium]